LKNSVYGKEAGSLRKRLRDSMVQKAAESKSSDLTLSTMTQKNDDALEGIKPITSEKEMIEFTEKYLNKIKQEQPSNQTEILRQLYGLKHENKKNIEEFLEEKRKRRDQEKQMLTQIKNSNNYGSLTSSKTYDHSPLKRSAFSKVPSEFLDLKLENRENQDIIEKSTRIAARTRTQRDLTPQPALTKLNQDSRLSKYLQSFERKGSDTKLPPIFSSQEKPQESVSPILRKKVEENLSPASQKEGKSPENKKNVVIIEDKNFSNLDISPINTKRDLPENNLILLTKIDNNYNDSENPKFLQKGKRSQSMELNFKSMKELASLKLKSGPPEQRGKLIPLTNRENGEQQATERSPKRNFLKRQSVAYRLASQDRPDSMELVARRVNPKFTRIMQMDIKKNFSGFQEMIESYKVVVEIFY